MAPQDFGRAKQNERDSDVAHVMDATYVFRVTSISFGKQSNESDHTNLHLVWLSAFRECLLALVLGQPIASVRVPAQELGIQLPDLLSDPGCRAGLRGVHGKPDTCHTDSNCHRIEQSPPKNRRPQAHTRIPRCSNHRNPCDVGGPPEVSFPGRWSRSFD